MGVEASLKSKDNTNESWTFHPGTLNYSCISWGEQRVWRHFLLVLWEIRPIWDTKSSNWHFNPNRSQVKEADVWICACVGCWVVLELSVVLKCQIQQDKWRWSNAPHVSISKQFHMNDKDSSNFKLDLILYNGLGLDWQTISISYLAPNSMINPQMSHWINGPLYHHNNNNKKKILLFFTL